MMSHCQNVEFFPLFFPNTAEGVQSLCHALIAGRSSQPARGVSAKLCSPCPPWGCPSRAPPAPHTPITPGDARGLCPPRGCSGVTSPRSLLGHHSRATSATSSFLLSFHLTWVFSTGWGEFYIYIYIKTGKMSFRTGVSV